MNVLAIVAGALNFVAFLAHATLGALDFDEIEPQTEVREPRIAWVQALCGWHWVSFDLFASSALLLAIGFTDWIPHESTVLMLCSLYYTACGLVWLFVLIIAGGGVRNRYKELRQWLFCFWIAGLTWFAQYS